MDRNRYHRPTEESQQLPPTEDEQRMSEEYFSLESSPSSNDGPVGQSNVIPSTASSQESSEYSSRTQLHPESGLAVRTSSRVLYYTSVETLPESISSGATLDPSRDINLPREALYSHTEDVVESEIPSQDVGASALEREMSHEPLRCGIATSEETQGPQDKALDPPGPSRRLGDNLQEFISKYSAEFHAIISDFSNFVKIVRLFTDHPNVLLGIIQIFIDNPELVRSTSQDAELTLPQPDQLPLNRRGSSSGASAGSDRNPETAGGSTVPNPPQSLSDDLGRTEGDLNAHINLLTKLDELKKILLHLQDRNDQEGNVKSGPGRRILGDSNAALKRSDQLEIESPSWKAEDSSKEPRPVASGKPSDNRKQGSEDRSTLPAAPDANVEQLCADHYLTKDSVTGQKSHQSEPDFLSQEVGKSSGEQQLEASREGVIKWVFKPTDSRNSDVPSDSSSSENSPRKDKKILQDPCDLDYSQTEPSRRLLDNQKHPAVLQASDESETECPSRKVGAFSKKPQPGSSSRFSAPDENAPRHRTDRHFTTDSASVKKSRLSELSLLSQEVGESGKEQELEPSEGVIKWFFTATDSRSSDVPSGPSSPERPIHKDGKSLEHTRTDKKEPRFPSHSRFDEPDFSKRPSDNREHAPAPKRSDGSEIEFSSRKVGGPCEEPKAGHSRRLLDHGKQSSEDRSSLSAAPEGSVEQYCADRSSTKDSAAEQKLRQSESKFLLQEVGEPGSLPCQFTDLVTEQAVKWFFKFSDTTISVVDSNSPCSERAATKDVKSPKDNHEYKKKPQGPCYIGSNQPGPSKKLLGNQGPAASLDRSGESEIDFPSRKVGKFSKEPQPGPRRKFSEHQKKISEDRSGLPIAPEENVEHRQGEFSLDRRKQSSEDRSHLPAAPDANVELQCADHYSAEDVADRQESHQSELEFSSEEVGGSGEEQPPEASKGHPSSPTTDLLTDEVVKWFFDLNNSIRLIVQSDLCSESTAPTDIISSEPTYTHNEEPQDPCHLAFDQSGSDVRKHAETLETSGESEIEFPSRKLRGSSDEPQAGPSRRSSEHQEQISESRSGLPKAPHENIEHRQADCYSTQDSAARQKSQKSKTKFASKEVGESTGEQLPGSKEGHFLTPSTDLLKGKVCKDSSRRVGREFKSGATGQDLHPPTPEEKSSPQLLNVGNVNELMGHLNPPPIPTTPCNVCHLRPMKFQELNFWYELHWKLVIDGGEREFESQAKPIVLVNSIESDEYFQDIKSRMPNPDEDSDRAHQKPHKYKRGKKEKKRNF